MYCIEVYLIFINDTFLHSAYYNYDSAERAAYKMIQKGYKGRIKIQRVILEDD